LPAFPQWPPGFKIFYRKLPRNSYLLIASYLPPHLIVIDYTIHLFSKHFPICPHHNQANLQEVGCVGMDWIELAQERQVVGICECGNEPSGSIKCGEFLD
jgi:hypothetical protein